MSVILGLLVSYPTEWNQNTLADALSTNNLPLFHALHLQVPSRPHLSVLLSPAIFMYHANPKSINYNHMMLDQENFYVFLMSCMQLTFNWRNPSSVR